MKRYIKSAVSPISNEDYETRREIAEITTAPKVLHELVYGNDYDTTLKALANPNLSIEDMYAFIKEDWDYRSALALNPNLPDDILNKLLNDKNSDVYHKLLWNPRLPEPEVKKLVESLPNTFSSRITIFDETKPIIMERLSKYCNDPDTLENIAHNPNVSEEILDRLSNAEDINVRCVVALNPNISQKTIKYLLNDPDQYVRESLAANPTVSNEDRQILAEDPSARVRRRAELYIQEYGE